MPKWTLDKELEDTAKAASSGFEMAEKAQERAKKKEGMNPDAPPKRTAGDDEAPAFGLFKRGGYVGARASGKRMYAKGGMVKGKSCG